MKPPAVVAHCEAARTRCGMRSSIPYPDRKINTGHTGDAVLCPLPSRRPPESAAVVSLFSTAPTAPAAQAANAAAFRRFACSAFGLRGVDEAAPSDRDSLSGEGHHNDPPQHRHLV